MSEYGIGTFKQDVLDKIKYHIESHNMNYTDACVELADILSHLINFAFYREESYIKIKEECYAKAKEDLLNGLKSMEK